MGLLDTIGYIGKGLERGGEIDAEQRKRRMLEDEQRRQIKEDERIATERDSLRRETHKLYGAENADMANEVAGDAAAGADLMEETAKLPGAGMFATALPFAAQAVRGVTAKAEAEAKKPSEFDPSVPYEKLLEIQQGTRRANDARANRSVTQAEARRRNDDLEANRAFARGEKERSHGDTQVGRGMLKRLAADPKSGVGYTPEEIDGLSETAVAKLAEQFGQGGLRTGDYRDRQTIKIDLTPPKTPKPKTVGDEVGEMTPSQLMALRTQQRMTVNNLLENPPRILGQQSVDLSGNASEILGRLTPEQRKVPDVQKWLASLQEAQQAGDIATGKTYKKAGIGNEPSPRASPVPTPAPGLKPRAEPATPQRSKEQWQQILAGAQAALKEDPNDAVAAQAVKDAKNALGGP